MLSSTFDMDIIHATSGAVYAIICSQKVHAYNYIEKPVPLYSTTLYFQFILSLNYYPSLLSFLSPFFFIFQPPLPFLLPSFLYHPLSSWLQESYLSLANTLITNQTDPHNQTRLTEAFSRLTPPSLPLDSMKTSKITFRKNLEQFLPYVKGFMCYK